jgi:hypothetical protein
MAACNPASLTIAEARNWPISGMIRWAVIAAIAGLVVFGVEGMIKVWKSRKKQPGDSPMPGQKAGGEIGPPSTDRDRVSG